ncbi:MAG: hypothetical protein ACK4XK_13495, partial [Casimicrobiaceae bacterium]
MLALELLDESFRVQLEQLTFLWRERAALKASVAWMGAPDFRLAEEPCEAVGSIDARTSVDANQVDALVDGMSATFSAAAHSLVR